MLGSPRALIDTPSRLLGGTGQERRPFQAGDPHPCLSRAPLHPCFSEANRPPSEVNAPRNPASWSPKAVSSSPSGALRRQEG